MTTTLEEQLRSPEFARIYAEESFVADVIEELCEWMSHHDVSRADLARRLGTSRANVTKLLDGRNPKLRTVAAVAHVLGAEPHFELTSPKSRPYQ